MSPATVVEVLVAAAVLVGVGFAATGRLGGLAEPPADALERTALDDLPHDRLRPGDLERVRFPLALRGYRMADVDAVLARLEHELADRDAELDRLRGGPLDPDRVAAEAPEASEAPAAPAAEDGRG